MSGAGRRPLRISGHDGFMTLTEYPSRPQCPARPGRFEIWIPAVRSVKYNSPTAPPRPPAPAGLDRKTSSCYLENKNLCPVDHVVHKIDLAAMKFRRSSSQQRSCGTASQRQCHRNPPVHTPVFRPCGLLFPSKGGLILDSASAVSSQFLASEP